MTNPDERPEGAPIESQVSEIALADTLPEVPNQQVVARFLQNTSSERLRNILSTVTEEQLPPQMRPFASVYRNPMMIEMMANMFSTLGTEANPQTVALVQTLYSIGRTAFPRGPRYAQEADIERVD